MPSRILAAWMIVGFVLYLMLVSPVSRPEVVLGAVLSVPVAVLAVVATRAFGEDLRTPEFVRRELLALPRSIVADCARLTWWLVRHPVRPSATGRTRVESLPAAPGADRRAVRAHEVLLRSASPGSFVVDVDVDDDPDRIRVHQLPGRDD